jgi:DNA polymerase III subunit delta'
VALLERALGSDRLSHAYLLSGPRDIGKRTLALQLARAALCLDSATVPCGTCASCRRFDSFNHPDLRIVELDAERVQISRQEIGRIQADASLKPLIGARKVCVIVEVERLSTVAGNQLLKLIEEPPPGLTFILTTTDLDAVLPTIVSRCQVVRMQPVARETIELHLVQQCSVDSSIACGIAQAADGRIGWAIRAGANQAMLEHRSLAIQDLVKLIEAGGVQRLLKSQEMAARWTNDRAGVIEELDWWARSLRDLAISAVVAGTDAVESEGMDRLARIEGRLGAEETIQAARATQQTALLLEQNVHPRIALDTLLLDLPRLSKG